MDCKADDLQERLGEWSFYYDWFRPHRSLGGKTPVAIVTERAAKTPCWDDVSILYDRSNERIQNPNLYLL